MRKKGLFLKLGFLGIGMLTTSAVVVSTFANVNTNVTTAKADSGDFYQISYAGGELKILFSATPSSYAHLNATALTNLKNSLFTAVSNAIADKITVLNSFTSDTASGLTFLEWTPRYYAYTPTSGMDAELLEKIISASLTTNGVADIDKVDAFNNDSTGAYGTIVSYYADKYADAHPELNRDEVYADIAGVVQDKAQEITTEAYLANGYTMADVPTAATSVVTAVSDTLVTGVDIELNDLTQMMGIVQDTMAEDSSITVNSFVTNLGQAAVANEIKDVLADASADDVQDFMIKVQPEVIADTITAVDLTKDDMLDLLDTVGLPKLLTIAETIDVDGLKTILEAVPGFTAADLKDFVRDNASALSIADIFNALNTVAINGHTVLDNGQFNKSGIKSVLADLPRPTEIAGWTDDQMNITWDVAFSTSLGNFNIPVTVGFFGNCDLIRTVAEYAGKAFDFSLEGGVIRLHVKAGNYLARFVRKVINSNLIPTSMLKEAFEFLTKDVQGMYEMINTKLLSDIIADLQGIDYEDALGTVLSADFLNSTFNTSSLTDEKIDKVIDTFMKIFRIGNMISFDQFLNLIEKVKDLTPSQEDTLENLYNRFVNLLNRIDGQNINSAWLRTLVDSSDDSISNQTIYDKLANLANYSDVYDRVQNLITKIYNKLPASFKTRSFMNTYQGNGVWAFADSFTFDVHDVLTSLTATYGDDIYNALTSVLGSLPTSVSVDLSFEAKEMYSISYDFGNGDVVTGPLPSGVGILDFALLDNVNGVDIVKWVDANGDEVTMMPEADVTVYAVTDFEITTSADVTKTYDGASETISVTVADPSAYTYQWKKNGSEIAGATSDALLVTAAADTGSYTCVVTRTSDGYVKESDPIAVTIYAESLDVSGVRWDYEDPFTYDALSHTVAIDPTTLPAGVGIIYNGVREATAAGTYTAYATLYSLDGSVTLAGQTNLTLNWTIGTVDITVDELDWDYTEAFTFDGTEKEVSFDELNLPEHIIVVSMEDTTATNAGTYTAKVVLGTDNANYTINGQDEAEFTLTWKINKATVSVTGVNWSADEFLYDGTAKSVTLNGYDSTKVTVTYTGDKKATNAGQYVVNATIALIDADNYELVGATSLVHDWVINQAELSVAGAAWNYTAAFTYNGNNRTVSVKADSIANGVVVTYTGTRTAKDAGTYQVTANFAAPNANYKLVGATTTSITWKIEQQEINLSSVAWNAATAFTYNGSVRTVTLDPTTVPDHVVVTYGGTYSAMNAGSYTATATLAAENANYKLVGTTTYTLNWSIAVAQIDVSGVASNYDDEFTFDDTVHSVGVDMDTLPEHVTAVVTGTYTAVNAGTYTAVITLSADSANYELVGNTTITVTWKINAKEINVNGVKWNAANYTYTGSDKKVSLNENTIPANVTANYSGTTKAKDAGTYEAIATLSADSANYVLVGETTLKLTWTIAKATVTLMGATWDSFEAIDYDGNEHTVSVNPNSIPAGVTVTYTGTRTAKEIGDYTVTATFALTAELAKNYELKGELTSTFNWSIVRGNGAADYDSEEKEDGKVNGHVVANMSIDGTLHIVLKDAEELTTLNWKEVLGDKRGSVHAYYEVYFEDANGNRINVGTARRFEVKLLLPAEAAARQAKYSVVSVAENGKLTKLESTREGDYMLFNTNLLGNFAIVEVGTSSTPWWVLGLLIAAGAVIAVETYVIIVKGKKKAN